MKEGYSRQRNSACRRPRGRTELDSKNSKKANGAEAEWEKGKGKDMTLGRLAEVKPCRSIQSTVESHWKV